MMIVNGVTTWSMTLESSITLLDLSMMFLGYIYSTAITHDDNHTMIIICL
jgi:hypothetical protein